MKKLFLLLVLVALLFGFLTGYALGKERLACQADPMCAPSLNMTPAELEELHGVCIAAHGTWKTNDITGWCQP